VILILGTGKDFDIRVPSTQGNDDTINLGLLGYADNGSLGFTIFAGFCHFLATKITVKDGKAKVSRLNGLVWINININTYILDEFSVHQLTNDLSNSTMSDNDGKGIAILDLAGKGTTAKS
jgi:hypothetical protein